MSSTAATGSLVLAALMAAFSISAFAQEQDLGSPVACDIGTECFVQQYPDLDPGPEASDPWCGGATYDGHDGTDIRVRTMSEVGGVAVLALQDGQVLRTRDGISDHLMLTDADRAAVQDIECGNGVVMETTDGLELQYCHLALGSVIVEAGDPVAKGETIGLIGASGMAAFPHVHVTVRRDGDVVDPSTGRLIGDSCGSDAPASMWDEATAGSFAGDGGQLLASGFSGSVPDHDRFVVEGPPGSPSANSEAFVGWAWFINLAKGDVISLKILGEDGSVFAESVLEPLDRNKATYSAYVGKRGLPAAGRYTLEVLVDGSDISASSAIDLP